ncbi:MAG: cyclic nucleotide-binding domain-containing protein [Actinomycetota bacterium]
MAESTGTRIDVRVASDDEDLARVARLRYRVYCEQLNLLRHLADHEQKTLRLPNDERSRIVLAERDGEAIGTVRIVPGAIARSEADTVECFQLNRFDGLMDAARYVVADRFMVEPDQRAGNLAGDLMSAASIEAFGLGATTGFACCEAHLVPLYRNFGFVPYTRLYNHPTSGILVPLVFVGDHDHLAEIGSPLAGFFTDELRSPITIAQVREAFGTHLGTADVDASTVDALDAFTTAADSRPRMLDGFTREELDLLTSRGADMRFAPGDALIRSGQTARTLYVLLEGACEVRRDGVPLAMLAAGDVVGEMTFLLEDRRSGDVVAVSDVRAVAFQASALNALIDERDPIAVRLLRNLARVVADRLAMAGSDA